MDIYFGLVAPARLPRIFIVNLLHHLWSNNTAGRWSSKIVFDMEFGEHKITICYAFFIFINCWNFNSFSLTEVGSFSKLIRVHIWSGFDLFCFLSSRVIRVSQRLINQNMKQVMSITISRRNGEFNFGISNTDDKSVRSDAWKMLLSNWPYHRYTSISSSYLC